MRTSVLDNDRRWQHVWWFLSLDDTREFFEDLWVRLPDKHQFATGLREVLSPYMNDPDYFLSNPGLTSIAAFRWAERSIGRSDLSRLICWADKVFIGSASERNAEWLWSMIAARLLKDSETKATVPAWIRDLFILVKDEEAATRSRFEAKLDRHFELSPSEWDSSAFLARDTNREAVGTSLSLIGKRNIFVKVWAYQTDGTDIGKLAELYELGKRLAAMYSLDNQGLAFPGAWGYELLPATL